MLAVKVAVKYWYVTVPVLVLLGAVAILACRAAVKRQAARDVVRAEEAAAAAARQRESEAERAARHRELEAQRLADLQAWLAGSPPMLIPPGRFTENWFAENVPSLHPGQVPMLFAALRARGWSDDKIVERLAHHLARNEFLATG